MDGVVMDKNFFNEQIKRLVIEYSDKGFSMSKERATQWYETLSNFKEDSLSKAICEVLMTCSYSPTIADIFKTGKLTFEPVVRTIEEIERLKRES